MCFYPSSFAFFLNTVFEMGISSPYCSYHCIQEAPFTGSWLIAYLSLSRLGVSSFQYLVQIMKDVHTDSKVAKRVILWLEVTT